MALRPQFVTQQAANFGRNLLWHLSVKPEINRLASIRKNDIVLVTCTDRQTGPFDHFFTHYRTMGVNRILIIKTCANPAIDAFAQANEDVTTFGSTGGPLPFEALFQIRNAILQRHFRGHMCLFAEPGEYLLYPNMATRDLRDLGEFLITERRVALHAVALDAYATQPLGDPAYGQEGDPFGICRFIDRDFLFEEFGGEFTTIVRGGPVMRLLTPDDPRSMTILNRIPLATWRWSTRFTDGHGGMRPFKAMKTIDWKNAITSAVLIRFPFVSSGFATAADHAAHVAGLYGTAYGEALRQGLTLHDPGISREIGSVDSLMRAGLMSRGNWF